MNEDRLPRILVGITPEPSAHVVAEAARFAERFRAELVFAWVDASRYAAGLGPDGIFITLPLDPDAEGYEEPTVDPALEQKLSALLTDHPLPWSVRSLAGAPAQELEYLAEDIEPEMIIVGTREAGLRGSLRELLSGSVAVHLAHHQERTVVVVPLGDQPPPQDDEGLPDPA